MGTVSTARVEPLEWNIQTKVTPPHLVLLGRCFSSEGQPLLLWFGLFQNFLLYLRSCAFILPVGVNLLPPECEFGSRGEGLGFRSRG